ncbi:MAG: hypothetical protein GWO24_02935, partial [Akkermansiaceae bacterium]|nr:hypothetical protein [Akkermansiaceae bacterium]
MESPGEPKVYANRATGVDLGPDGDAYRSSVVLAPILVDDAVPGNPLTTAWSVLAGDAVLSDPSAAQPRLTFGSTDFAVLRLEADDGEVTTFDEVTLSGQFHQEVLVASHSPARVHVPTSDALGAQWRDPGFDDSSWQSGTQGAGFNANPASSPDSTLYQTLIGTLDLHSRMYGLQSSCYLRIPFEIAAPEAILHMVLRLNYDDGFVAYINGHEVARSNA